MTHSSLASLFERFHYLSLDVADLTDPNYEPAKDHPQKIFECNNFDASRAEHYAKAMEKTAIAWSQLPHCDANPQFAKATQGLWRTLKAITATSAILTNGDQLLVERPGIESDKQRKLEASGFCKRVAEDYGAQSAADRLTFARLSLLGAAGMVFETVNYLDIANIPKVLGRMLARLDHIAGKEAPAENIIEALFGFVANETKTLAYAGLERVGLPIGTRPRVYVPTNTIKPNEQARLAALDMMQHGTSRADALFNFLTIMWRDFADEGFVALHEGKNVEAYAVLSGGCYFYQAVLAEDNSRPTVRGMGEPLFVRDAGPYTPTPWRRHFDQLDFSSCPPPLIETRRQVMLNEALPQQERTVEALSNKMVRKAAALMLGRQIDHNMTCVLNGEMGAPAVLEWSPNMSRDRFGKVFNQPHAFGGVEDMMRGRVEYGGHLSQIRTWREREGTHEFTRDASQFKGYQEALRQFLNHHAPAQS